MIHIYESETADSRTCDSSKVTKEQLLVSSKQHIRDVTKGLEFFSDMLLDAALVHDHDKISDIDGFHRDFITDFKSHAWWDNHPKVNRHHLLKEKDVPSDVNLVDIIEMITDCVMAGMGRSGSVYKLNIMPSTLMTAFQNTVELLKNEVVVEKREV